MKKKENSGHEFFSRYSFGVYMIGGEKVAHGFIMHTCYPKLWTSSFLIFRGKVEGELEVQSWYKQRSGKFVRNCFKNFVICEWNFIRWGRKKKKKGLIFLTDCISFYENENSFVDRVIILNINNKNRIIVEKFSARFIGI